MKLPIEILQKELLTLRRRVAKLEEQCRRQENIADSERSLLKRINEQLREEIQIRRRAEKSLKESEQRFRTLFEKIPDAIIVANLDGKILDVNKMVCGQLGYTREELLAMYTTDIDPHIKKYNRKTTLLPWLLRDMQITLETIFEHRNGQFLPVELDIILMEISKEPVTLTIARNITNKIENEKTIKELVGKLSAIFNQSIDGILVADIENYKFLFSNPAIYKITGYNESDLKSMTVMDLHPQKYHSKIIDSFRSIINMPAIYLSDTQIVRKNGSTKFVDINASFAFIEERPCCVAIFRDMTERKRLEEMKRDVERIILQDIKAPLNSINNIAQTLFMEKLHHSQLDRIFDIHAIGSRLLKHIDLHNEIQNMEQGTYQPIFEWFDFRTIFKNIELYVGQQAEVKLVRIIHHDSEPPNFGKLLYFGEPTLLESMLANLVLNAVEASPNYSEVTLSYEKIPGHVLITIHNLGMVPKEIQERFFDKYATFGKPKGTGLGTYSAKLIAQAHGGAIAYETDAAAGTTVTVKLPLSRNSSSSP